LTHLAIFGKTFSLMVEHTKGVVLSFNRYSDSSGIVNLFTHRFGRRAYLARGINKGKKEMKNIFFQPLSILDIEASHHEGREVHNMSRCALSYIPSSLPYSVTKSTIAIFLAEVLNATIREESADYTLYDFIEESVINLDRLDGNASWFHISFMVKLSSYLGFGPSLPDSDEPLLFDMTNGLFSVLPPVSGIYMNHEQTALLKLLIATPLSNAGALSIAGHNRRSMLDQLIKFYSMHTPGLKNIKSLKVLQEVFG
jgi:DNA repair protein RecO (recombination protein O)